MAERFDDERLDSSIKRLVGAAGDDAPEPPEPPFGAVTEIGASARRRRRPWLVGCGVAAAAAAIVGVVALAAGGDHPSTGPTGSAPLSTFQATPVAPATTTSTPVVPAATTASGSTASTTTTPVASEPEEGIIRPVTDASVCAPYAAREIAVEGPTVFGQASAFPTSMQVIADPSAGPTGGYAVVLRRLDREAALPSTETTTINDTTYRVQVYDNGDGVAEWNVGDGTRGYVRSRGLNRDTLVSILDALTPRSLDASIPGFDIDDSALAPSGLASAEETMIEDMRGTIRWSVCKPPGSDVPYWVSSVSGDPVFEYWSVLDRPPPLAVAERDGAVIVITGQPSDAAPTIDDVHNADIGTWSALLAQSDPRDVPATGPTEGSFGQATVAPTLVTPGERFTVTPSAPVAQVCDGYVAVYRYTDGNFDQVAQAAPIGRPWQLSDADIPFTVPAGGCDDHTTDTPADYELPADMPSGVYVICLSRDPSEPACATLGVTAPTSVALTPWRLLAWPDTYGGEGRFITTIFVRDDCVLGLDPNDGQPLVIAWPPGFELVDDHIESPDGAITIRPGDTITASGGYFPFDQIPDPTFANCVTGLDAPATDELAVIGRVTNVEPAPQGTISIQQTLQAPTADATRFAQTEVFAYIDAAGRRCLTVSQTAGRQPAWCVDQPDVLNIFTATDLSVLIGTTDDPDAARIVLDTPDGPVDVALQGLPDWPERAFASELPANTVSIRLVDDDGNTLATTFPE